MKGKVASVASSDSHSFSKTLRDCIYLLAGLGVEGDAHSGKNVQHRSRVARDPTQPNLRQVHLIHAELFDELRDSGFEISPGQLGENITTYGIDLLALPQGTRLHLGGSAIVTVTGLRNPCAQLDHYKKGLLEAVLSRDEKGNIVRKAGIMGIVSVPGRVRPGDKINVELPEEPYIALERV